MPDILILRSIDKMENGGKRLNKYISDAGICSRREADRLIEAGKVEIRRHNRKDEPENPRLPAGLGTMVLHGDTVYVRGEELPKKEPERFYYMYHKPRGVVCTCDRETEGNLADAVHINRRFSYAGRLDKDTSGLLILTNDGELIDRMMRASSGYEKEYICTVNRDITAEFINAMGRGVRILLDDDAHLRKNPEGVYVTTRPCRVRKLEARKFMIVLTQGYNRQIRRMCRALGYQVSSLERTRILSLKLGALKSGAMRRLTDEELRQLLKETGKKR